MAKKELEIKNFRIDEVKPYENNPRFNKDAVDKVANSIKKFGFKNPILVDKNMVIIAGHTRLEAAKKLKLEEVPVIIADDLDEKHAKALRLADNKVAEFSTWDFVKLDAELAELGDAFDFSDFGFGEDFVEQDEDEPKEPREVSIESNYQVIIDCADETEQQDVFERLNEEGFKCRLSTL